MLRGKRVGMWGIAGVALLGFGATGLPLFARASGACAGTNEPVLALINGCPEVAATLGDSVEFGLVGCAHGETETSGDNGESSWRMPISGSKARGSVRFAAVKRGGAWKIHQAIVTVDDVDIDVVRCLRSGTGSVAGGLIAECEEGLASACHALGSMYETGTTVEKDAVKATHYYARACKLGFQIACYPAEKPAEKETP